MGEEMEANTCYLGIELNDSYAMVSYMQPNMEEPETVSTIAGSENYQKCRHVVLWGRCRKDGKDQ